MQITPQGSSPFFPKDAWLFFPYTFLFFWCGLIFWQGRVGLPVEDQGLVMWERVFSQNDWDFFGRMISFNRTRLVNAGDAYLFRPATHALIALGDIFFRDRFFAAGLTSIIFLSLTAMGVFYWLSHLVKKHYAFFLTLALVTPFSASKIVLWRHISGYLWCPGLLSLGLLALQKRSYRAAGALFFMSALFHEAAPLALGISGVVICLLPEVKDRKAIAASMLLPTLLFLAWSVTDFLVYQGWRSPFGSSSPLPPPGFFATCGNIVYFTGITLFAHLFPHWVHFEKRWDETTYWDFSHVPFTLSVVLSLAFFAMVFFLYRKRKELPVPQVLVPLCFFAITVLSLVVGRVAPRGWEYLYRSPYYFFFTSWALTALFALVLRFESRAFLRTLVISMLTVLTVSSSIRLQSYLARKAENEILIAEVVEEIRDALVEHPDWCYAGATEEYLHRLDPLIFFEQSCRVNPGSAVFASLAPDRRLIFKSLEPLEGPTVPLSKDLEANAAIDRLIGPNQLRLTTSADRPLAISVGPAVGSSNGVLLNYENQDNFSLLFLEQFRVFQLRLRNGKMDKPYLVGYSVRAQTTNVSVRQMGNRLWAFWGNSVVGPLQNESSLHGRFGALCAREDSCPEQIRVENRFEFRPLVSRAMRVPENARSPISMMQ